MPGIEGLTFLAASHGDGSTYSSKGGRVNLLNMDVGLAVVQVCQVSRLAIRRDLLVVSVFGFCSSW